MTEVNCSTVSRVAGTAVPMPALLTSTSTRPNSAIAASMSAWQSGCRETPVSTAIARRPVVSTEAAVSASRSTQRAPRTRSAPTLRQRLGEGDAEPGLRAGHDRDLSGQREAVEQRHGPSRGRWRSERDTRAPRRRWPRHGPAFRSTRWRPSQSVGQDVVEDPSITERRPRKRFTHALLLISQYSAPLPRSPDVRSSGRSGTTRRRAAGRTHPPAIRQRTAGRNIRELWLHSDGRGRQATLTKPIGTQGEFYDELGVNRDAGCPFRTSDQENA